MFRFDLDTLTVALRFVFVLFNLIIENKKKKGFDLTLLKFHCVSWESAWYKFVGTPTKCLL